MKCTDKEWQHCRVEKMGCPGCYYDEIEVGEWIRNKDGYIDKDTKIPIDLDEIKKQIVKQFNVAAGVFECEISAITRQFEMTQEQYKNKYLGRW